MKKLLTLSALLATTMALTACQSMPMGSNLNQPVLKSTLHTVDMNAVPVGEMYLRPVDNGIQVFGKLRGLTPGATVAVHIHETGSCDNDGKAAGGHFHPTNQPHGHPSSTNHHAGDLPNVTANSEGVAMMNFVNHDISVDMTASNSVYNRAFIVHSGADDYVSQPSGNSGERIACGVIEAM